MPKKSSKEQATAATPVPKSKVREANAEPGLNLKEDLRAAINNPDLSDVVFTCSDGVTLYASRLMLAFRSDMLRNMLCGHMREAHSKEVSLSKISSVQFSVILEFCYTEETPSLSLDNAIEVFKAAEFFILPRLQEMVAEYVKSNLNDHASAGKMLSQAVGSLEMNAEDNVLFGVLRRFFLSKKLFPGHLASLSKEALEVLLADIDATKNCPTRAFDLFRCIIDWAFEIVGRTEADEDRQKLLAYLSKSHKIRKEKGISPNHGISRESIKEIGKVIMPVIKKIHFKAMCLHQLAVIVDTLTFIPPDILCAAFREHIGSDVITCDALLSNKWSLRWNHYTSDLRLSEKDKVIQHVYNHGYHSMPIISHYPLPDFETTEWEVVARNVGNSPDYTSIGLATPGMYLESKSNTIHGAQQDAWGIVATGQCYDSGSKNHFAHSYTSGAVLTFRADMAARVCTVWVNGVDSGVRWKNLPSPIYPAATISRHGILAINALLFVDL